MPDPAITVEQLVQQTRQLHSLPAVAIEVLNLTKDPKVDARAIKQCIETDPALTGKILRVVNSSLFGLSREVSDLNQALALLGTKPLKMLVLGFSLPDSMFMGLAGEILGWYWRRTLTKAVAARQLSETWWQRPGDEAFLAGLLQDLGILLLAQQLGEPYLRLVGRMRSHGGDLAAMETEAMGFDHTAVSARLLAHWGLSQMLVDAVAPGSQPASEVLAASVQDLRRIVHLAELVAQLVADGRSDVLQDVLAAGQQSCRLSPEQLNGLVGELEAQVGELANVFSLQLPDGLRFADVLAEAHQRLAEVAADTAGEMLRERYQSPASGESSEDPALNGALEEIRILSEAITGISARPEPAASEFDPAASGPPPPPPPTPPGTDTEVLPRRMPSSTDDPAETRAGGTPACDSDTVTFPRPTTGTKDAALLRRLAVLLLRCRQQHCPATLLLVDVDHAHEILRTSGFEGLEPPRRCIEAVCREVDHPGSSCAPLGEACFAVLLPDCDRQQAVRLANQLIDEVRHWAGVLDAWGPHPVGVSVGAATVAIPGPHFEPEELLERADRCLRASHASGGGLVKSIEIY